MTANTFFMCLPPLRNVGPEGPPLLLAEYNHYFLIVKGYSSSYEIIVFSNQVFVKHKKVSHAKKIEFPEEAQYECLHISQRSTLSEITLKKEDNGLCL